jgi:hypothetical protein
MSRSSGIVPAMKEPTRRGCGPTVAPDHAAHNNGIAGRTFPGPCRRNADRRLVACLRDAAQFSGSVVFICAVWTNVSLLLIAIVLFGTGFGNATSMPPLVAPRVRRARCAAGGRAKNRNRSGRLSVCSRGFQPGARIRSIDSGFVRRWCCQGDIHRYRVRPGHRDLRISTKPKPITLSDPGHHVKVELPSRTEKHRLPRASIGLVRRKSALGQGRPRRSAIESK